MKKRIIAMVLSVAMMLTMFPTGVLADDFVYEENAAGITENVEGQGNENQGEGETVNIVSEEPTPAETEDQTTEPAASASQTTDPVESESQVTEPVESESQATDTVESASQATEPVESESQTTDPAASASQAAEPEEKDNSVNTADLYDPQPTQITAEETKINVGQTTDLNGYNGKGWVTLTHEWSSGNENVATVTGDGANATVTGVDVGEAEISHHYYYKDWFGNKQGENTETIKIKVLAKVTDAAIQVTDDASATPVTFSKYAAPPVLEAVINPTDAEYKSCTWSVDHSDVLEVDSQTGEITAKSVGDATVKLTVTNYDDSEFTAELPVTVTNPVPTSAEISVTAGNAEDLYPGDTLTLVPRVEPGSADEYNYAWESSDESTATVAPVAGDATQATVTAMKDGTATITLTVTPKPAEAAASADEASPAADAAQPVKAELAVTVKAVTPAESVTIRSDKETVRVRETVQFTAAVNPTNAQGSYEWNTDDEQVLTIDETTGLATGKAAGTANVTVTFKGKDGKKTTSNSIEITVTAAAQQDKREALVYYLLDPNKDANSNDSGQWGPNSLGTATVDVAGATWHDAVVNGKTEQDKNCFDNLDTRVVSWPDTCPGGVVRKDTDPNSVWMSIFNKWKTTANSIPGTAVTPDDVVEIKLVPAKISKDNGTTPDMHLDCNVVVRCKNRVTVSFQLKDVDDKLVKAQDDKVYYVNSKMPVTAVPSVASTKLDKEGKEYAFRGWYRNKDFSELITFNGPYQLGTDNVTFYGRYVEKHQVTYDLDGGSWAGDNTLVYDVYEGDTYTVKADPTREGYKFNGWETSVTIENGQFTMPDNDVTLKAKWIPTTRSYTVNYYWNGTTTPVHDSTTGTANVGEKIENLEPVSVEGYTPVSTESKSIIIDEDVTKNVITFFYYKDVTLTANSATETYDGTPKSVSGFTGAPEGADFSAITVDATGTDAGTYPANFPDGTNGTRKTIGTVDATEKYIVTAANNGKLTIAKRTVTLKSADLSKEYDGTALVNGETALETETGWADGEGATYTFTGSQTVVGGSANAFSYTLNDGTNADNYTITKTEGTLTVTNRAEKYEITITAKSGTKTYNGKEQEVTGFVTDKFTVNGQEYTVSGLSAEAKGTDAGEYTATVTGIAVVKDAAGNDVTAQFNVKTENGKLTIAKRTVTLKSADLNKKYDGTALTNGKTALETETGWVEGEGATYEFTGSQTLVGSSANEFSYTLNKGTKADNYEIAKTEGTLTVENRAENEKYEITITANSGTKTYNGGEQKITGFVTDKFTVNGQEYTVSGLTAEAKGTDAGKYTTTVTGTAVVKDDAKNDVTAQFTVKTELGTLTITPVEDEVVVRINGNTKTVPYNREKHTVTGYEMAGTNDTLYTKDDFELVGSAEAFGTDAGTYKMNLKPEAFKNNNQNFTNVRFEIVEDGWLKITPKNIVPGENNKDLTATAPEDVVYSGKSQQQKPEVKDGDTVLEEGKDYDLSYSEDTTNAGTVTVTITGKGNYDSKFEVTYQITPASLKITTNSAEKTYDGSALTADGKIEGVAERDENDVKLNITGSQTEVGESKNTYTIEWGNANAKNYKIAEEDIGTLKVNARSGGGSSSKPTPEDEPTPTPTPTPLPTLPTTPAPTTPTRRVTRSTATVTQPASRPTEQITENETPKAESEPEVIEDEETPLAPMAGGAWALVNLILMLLTVLASLLLLLGYLGKKKYAKEDEYGNALHDANGNEIIDYTRNKKGFWRVASLIPAIAAVIAFALTENMRLPMVMTDRWTLLMVIIAVVQLIVAVLCKKKKESEEDENQANA